MTEHSPTPEQASIIAEASTPSPLMIRAYAGAAKTSTLLMAAPQVRMPSLALAFNKRIALELRGKLPDNFQVLTLNGLGHLAWMRSLAPSVRLELDDRKLGKLVSSVAKAAGMQLSESQWASVRQLTSAAMQAGLTPSDQGNPLQANIEEWWESAAAALLIGEDEAFMLIELAQTVLSRSVEMARQGIISFDDQVYCPTVLGGKWPQFPCVFIDEAQDLSPLNHAMLRLASRSDAKIVAVGDPAQAIYAFRGADSSSMQNMRSLRASWTDLSLSTTFRCPKAIVARQQVHAPGFNAFHSNAEGRFARLQIDGGWTFSDLQEMAPSSNSIAILCRNNAPLLSLAFKLIRRGIGPVMLGRDIGKGLQTLVRKLLPEEAGADIMYHLIKEWEISECSRAQISDSPSLQDSIHDRAEALLAVLDGSGATSRGDLLSALERVFSAERGACVLATGHRAKGLEWDCVLHLDPWRIPSRWARAAARDGDDAALEQEFNLRYVIETRTRNVLLEAQLDEFV